MMKKIAGVMGWGVAVVAMLALGAQTLQAQQESAGAAATVATLQARLSALAPQVAYLKDRRDIFDTMKRYTRGADRHDKDLVRSAFWPDATISFDKPQKLDEYVEQEEALLATYAAHQHHITGQTIDIDGTTAHVESYVIYLLVPRDHRKDVAGPAKPGRALTSAKSTVGSGRYIERWEKRNGEWRILVRRYVEDLQLQGDTVDWCGPRPCKGTWDRNDPSYVRPLQPVAPEQARPTAHAGGEASEVLVALDKKLALLESDTKQVADETAIQENELRYTRGLDRHDANLARAAYWDDAVITYGNVVPVETIGTWANSVHAKRAAHQHHVTALNLDINGDTAHEEGYILFTSDIERDTRLDTSGTPSPGRVLKGTKATLGSGRYINRYAQRNGQWKMVAHEYVHDLSVRFTPVDLCATACSGRWDRSDLSYQRPLQPVTRQGDARRR
jgi:hypothetical protein